MRQRIVNNIYIKLMEECGELTQAVAKEIKYKDEVTNLNLAEEAGDVMAFIYLMKEAGIIPEAPMEEKRKNTIIKYRGLFYGRGYGRPGLWS